MLCQGGQDKIKCVVWIQFVLCAAVRMDTNGVSYSGTLGTLFITNDARSDMVLMLPMLMLDSALSPSFMSSSLVSVVMQGIV